MVHGAYGQFQVLVDDKVIVDGGPLAFLGILPPLPEVLRVVRATLAPPAA
jgi:hypothetical protein